jgi:hypothetical protein
LTRSRARSNQTVATSESNVDPGRGCREPNPTRAAGSTAASPMLPAVARPNRPRNWRLVRLATIGPLSSGPGTFRPSRAAHERTGKTTPTGLSAPRQEGRQGRKPYVSPGVRIERDGEGVIPRWRLEHGNIIGPDSIGPPEGEAATDGNSVVIDWRGHPVRAEQLKRCCESGSPTTTLG